MDPRLNQKDSGQQQNPSRSSAYLNDSRPGVPGDDQTPSRDAPDGGNPQHSGAFTVIPPNESRRNQIKMIAQKEEEDLQRWREANRVTSVHLNPEKLGGNATLSEAREKQHVDLHCSKLQKKLRKAESDLRARQEEEEKLQKKKDEQREKAERLQERSRQEEQRRREQHRQDHLRKTDRFLQRFERPVPAPPASSRATHTSSRSEAVESTQRGREARSLTEVQLEHKRVNSAFLDRLEGQSRGSEEREEPSNAPGPPASLAHLSPDPERSSDWTEEADLRPDYDWALMKLMDSFPDCCKVFLEEILDQCHGDYEQAFALLASLS